MKMPYGGLTAD